MGLKEIYEPNTCNEFTIRIDFERGSEHPERIFNTMAELINAFHELDKSLIKTYAINIDPVLILQDIETGSIKTKLASILNAVDDEALKELDWKKAVGGFLLKAKYKILEFYENKSEITSIEQIKELGTDLLEPALESDVQFIPFYNKIPEMILLHNIARLAEATHNLTDRDKVTFISSEGEITINKRLFISADEIEELLTKHIFTNQEETILLVKKPDYLGQSMWDVQYKGKITFVKILDQDWLNRFQSRKVDLLPGDSLRVLIHEEIRFGENNLIIAEQYSVLKVYDVIKNNPPEQQKLIE